MRYLSAIQVKALLESKGVSLLDVREPYECEVCSIGGIQIPMAEVSSKISELNKTEGLIVMCKTGKRAEAIANLLESEYGFEDVVVMQGGIEAWIAEVDPNLEV